MTRNRTVLLVAVAAVTSTTIGWRSAVANPKVNQPAPLFTVTDTKGTTHSLESFKGKWVVLEWFNHECPYTRKHYMANNIQTLQREYTEKGVVWISVVSSAPGQQGYGTAADADRLTQMIKAVPSFVVRDTAGVLGRMYGARTTPQLFAIDPEGVLRYAGAIDDKPTPSIQDVKTARNYIKAALDAGLAGKPIAVATTQPYGCDVKY